MLGYTPLTLFFISDELFFFLSEAQKDALVLAHAQWTYIDASFVVWSEFLVIQSYSYNWPQVVLQHTLVGCNNGTPCIWHQIMNSVI